MVGLCGEIIACLGLPRSLPTVAFKIQGHSMVTHRTARTLSSIVQSADTCYARSSFPGAHVRPGCLGPLRHTFSFHQDTVLCMSQAECACALGTRAGLRGRQGWGLTNRNKTVTECSGSQTAKANMTAEVAREGFAFRSAAVYRVGFCEPLSVVLLHALFNMWKSSIMHR